MAEQQTLGDLGEFELIDIIARGLAPGGTTSAESVLVGPGDDGAVLRLAGDRAVVSTDVLVEGVHFRRDWSTAIQVGRKAVAVNVSDIEAMGARPVGLVLGFSAPADLPVTWLRYLVQGIAEECATAGVWAVGGDVTRADQVVLSVTVIGDLADREPVRRNGARAGDVVAVLGTLGWAAAGYSVLRRGFGSPRAVVNAHKVPSVPYGQGRVAAEAGASAMIDVSDGLLSDLGHIAAASEVTIDVLTDAFEIAEPVQAVASATGASPLVFMLTGGEDHALAATFAPHDVPAGWNVIGRVLPYQDGPRVTVDGGEWDGATGWDHFRR